MTPMEFAVYLESEVAAIIAEEALIAGKWIRSQTPSSRRKTKQAIFVRVAKATAIVGLKFAREYAGRTETHKRFERQWRELRPLVRQRIIQRFNDIFKGS